MSAGPGRIERAVEMEIASSPAAIFTTEDLCRAAYPSAGRIEKKHRVAVLRAGKKAAWRQWWSTRLAPASSGGVLFYNLCDLRSFAAAKATTMGLDAGKVLAFLDGDAGADIPPSVRDGLGSGGLWRLYVERNCADRDGDAERGDALQARISEIEGRGA